MFVTLTKVTDKESRIRVNLEHVRTYEDNSKGAVLAFTTPKESMQVRESSDEIDRQQQTAHAKLARGA